jgi:hypothetical protein
MRDVINWTMQNTVSAFSLLVVMSGYSLAEGSASDLIGVWKSDEQKTLASMNQTTGVTKEAKKIFEDNFFGRLKTEFRKDEWRAYFDAEEDNVEGMEEFRPYTLIEETDKEFTIEYYDEMNEEKVTKVLHREGNCYWLPVSRWQFREYFCKVSK